MPDLLRLRSLASRNPELYKNEVYSQIKALEARIQIFEKQPQLPQPELIELFQFLNSMAPSYKKFQTTCQDAFQLVARFSSSINPQTRLQLLKLAFSDYFILEKNTLQELIQLLNIKDKQLRAMIVQLMNTKFKITLQNQQIDILTKSLQNSSIIVKQTLLRMLVQLYKTNTIKSQDQYQKVVNAVAYTLVEDQDKRVILQALNFFTGADEELTESEDSDYVLKELDDVQTKDKVVQLTNSLKVKIKKYQLDLNKKKKSIEQIRKQIIKLNNKHQMAVKTQLFVIDYLRDPQTFAEKLIKKFLVKNSPFRIKLIIFDYISHLSSHYELVLPQIYPIFAKYIRPRQQNVVDILNSAVKSVHQHTDISDVLIIIKQIMNEFIHSGATDDEMTVAITAICEICKKVPECLLDEENIYLLNELVSYSKEKTVEDAHETVKSGSKTSSKTRKGVVNASKELLNFYRQSAPQALEKKYLDKESSIYLQSIKRINADQVVTRTRIETLLGQKTDSENDDQDDLEDSKWMKAKKLKQNKHLLQYLRSCRRKNTQLQPNSISKIEEILGYKINPYGEKIIGTKPEEEEQWEFEEEEVSEEDSQLADGEQDEEGDVFCLESEEEEQIIDPNLPIEQQRFLSTEELEKLRSFKAQKHHTDLDQFRVKQKMTSEEMKIHSKSGKSDEKDHRSNFWNRKADNKSKTNKEKQVNKAMMMLVHSRTIRAKANRKSKDKERVMREHLRNQKSGINKKVKR
ncbi:Sda1, severe depolymerization of actin [Spironucleus salmonicida]|uniref:Protein SDA1 n=1 Tax=Spironucleus salmonicida TaxID=348837 RepID=V6LKY4_9EUKA|nr:Sda1, severe depolymerization of actin [Spironucleus salmonicida]|eukprot:EST45212.1 Sda1, severe depolymerization of actin [Spironucleus salmonicida]